MQNVKQRNEKCKSWDCDENFSKVKETLEKYPRLKVICH